MTALLNEFLLKKWDRQQQTTIAIFLASASGEHFCAGTDFIGEHQWAPTPTHFFFSSLDIYNAVQSGDKQYARTFFRELYTMLQTINGLEKPFFPIMHGYTSKTPSLKKVFRYTHTIS